MILHDYQVKGGVLVWQNPQGTYPIQFDPRSWWISLQVRTLAIRAGSVQANAQGIERPK